MILPQKILFALFLLIGTFLTIAAGYIFLSISYERAYEKIYFGQSQSEMISSMGVFFSKRQCSFEIFDVNKIYLGKCSEIRSYSIPFQKWEFAFDQDGNLIEKYDVFLGEYGNRAPQ